MENNATPAQTAAKPDMAQQNQKDAAAFAGTFGQSYDAAETSRALDVMDSVDMPQNGVSGAPQAAQDGGAASVDGTGGAVGNVDKTLSGFQAGATNPVDRAGFGVARDISLGVLQAPREVSRGVVKGINGMIKFVDGAMDYLPTIGILDEQGNLGLPRVTTRGTAKERLDLQAQNAGLPQPDFTPQLIEPDAPKVDTVTGNVIQSIAQFATGFKGVDKLAKIGALGPKLGELLQQGGAAVNVVKGALGDLLAFDQHQERLSNVIQQVPALQNPVTDYLQAKPGDGFVEGKLKQTIEGLGLGAAGEVLFKGIGLLKQGLAARAEAQAAGGEAAKAFDPAAGGGAGPGAAAPGAAEAPGVDASHFSSLGDAGDPALLRQKKLDTAAAEVQGAFGQPKQIPSSPSPSINDYEINFARINGPDDIKQLMDEMVNKPELKVGIEGERRGAQSASQTLTAAQDIDGYESLLQRRTGDAFNAEQIVAGRKVYYDTTDKLMQAAKQAADPNAGAIDQFNFRKMLAIHHAVQKEFMGIRAEAGRALQAWSIPLGGTAPQNLRSLETVLSEFGGEGASRELAGKLAAMGDSLNTSQINMITQKTALARTADAVTEAWTLGLLTNPKTHVVNLASNVLTGQLLAMERYGMAAMPGSPVTFREAAEFHLGMFESQKLALKNMAQAFETGQTGFGVGKVDLPRVRATSQDILDPEGKAGIFSKALDGYGAILAKYAGGSLGAADEYSKTVLYQAQVRALATREGIAQGLEGDALSQHIADVLADPPAALRSDAADFANYGTFTRQLGKGGQAVQAMISANPLLRFIAPFIRTPGNIFKFAAERTPLALLAKSVRDDIGAGGLRRATALSRLGMGSSIMMMGADMALQGKVTGSGPSDPATKAALRRTGWQPYSVKIGDTWYSYARFEPVATLLGSAADVSEVLSNYEAYDAQGQEQADNLVTAAVLAAGNQVVGKTFLKGFADLSEVMSDPKRYGERFLQNFAGSFVPAGSAALAQAADPAQSEVTTMTDAIRSRLPGFSAAVPKRRNIWGEEIKYFYPNEKDVGSATAERVLSLFNPVYYSAAKDTPLDHWMLHNGFSIDMPDKSQVFGGVRIDLRDYPEIYSRLVEQRGSGVKLLQYGNQTMKQFFTNLATEKDPYGRHIGFFMAVGNSHDEQQNFISQVARDYQKAAKDQVQHEFNDQLSGLIAQGRRNAAALNAVRGPMQQGIAK